MQGDEHPTRILLRRTRESILEGLSEAFKRDEIGLDEFERRVDRAYAAATAEELTALVSDLTPLASSASASALVVAPSTGVTPVEDARGASLAVVSGRTAKKRGPVAIFASIERGGRFALENGSRAVAILGNVELDLRDVTLPAGVTELYVRAVMGNVEITVPPHLAVECEGSALFGSFSAVNRLPAEGTGDAPVLRVIGSAVFGNVEVHTRPRGQLSSAQPKLFGRGERGT